MRICPRRATFEVVPGVLFPSAPSARHLRIALSTKVLLERPVTLTPFTSFASFCAPLSTTPPHAHRSTSSRRRTIDIDRQHTSAGREVGRVLFARSPNPHPPTHHLTFACARPLSCRRRRSRSSTQKNSCFSARQKRKDCARARARARFVSSSCASCSSCSTTFGDGGETRQQRPRSSWLLSYSHHNRTHVCTLCAGALHGALAMSVQPVKRAARDRGPILDSR